MGGGVADNEVEGGRVFLQGLSPVCANASERGDLEVGFEYRPGG